MTRWTCFPCVDKKTRPRNVIRNLLFFTITSTSEPWVGHKYQWDRLAAVSFLLWVSEVRIRLNSLPYKTNTDCIILLVKKLIYGLSHRNQSMGRLSPRVIGDWTLVEELKNNGTRVCFTVCLSGQRDGCTCWVIKQRAGWLAGNPWDSDVVVISWTSGMEGDGMGSAAEGTSKEWSQKFIVLLCLLPESIFSGGSHLFLSDGEESEVFIDGWTAKIGPGKNR